MKVRIPAKRGITLASSGRWCGSDTPPSLAQRYAPDLWRPTGRRNDVRRTGTLLLVAAVCAACGSSRAAPRPLHVEDAYLGLKCGKAYPCPHLGIAVWLTAPQRRVTITLHGHRVRLATHRRYEYRRYWQGFVRDPTAEHIAGDGNRTVRLEVESIGRDGNLRHARLLSAVSPGWG
jgi:hypothetical protein